MKRMSKFWLCLASAWGLGSYAHAEVLSAQAVLQAALEHSYSRRSAEQIVQSARAREEQAKARGLPTLDVGARASQYSGLEEVALGALVVPEIDQRYSAYATVTQPIYTGGRISGQQEAETLTRQAADAAQSATTSGVALDALTTYWAWSRAQQAVEAAQVSVDRMQSLYDDLRNQQQAGLATENDLLATEVERERANLRLETSRQQLHLARARITFLTGVPVSPEATPEYAPVPTTTELADERALIATAYRNRAERAARQAEVAAAAARVKVSQADRGPTVNVRAGYEYANPNNLFFPPDDEWNDDAYAGVEASWNVWDSGLTRSRVAEAVSLLQQAELRRDQVDEDITLQVREARIRLQEALNRQVVTVRAQDSARRNLASATTMWKNGLARQSEVLDAQARLAEADQALVGARADVASGRAGLDYACGVLGPAGSPNEGAAPEAP